MMALVSPRRQSCSVVPGTPLALDWGSAHCAAEAIVVGVEHALVLSPTSLEPGTQLEVENMVTREKASFSVVWCSASDAIGHCKLGLRASPPATALLE
jgi:hypothetical protein